MAQKAGEEVLHAAIKRFKIVYPEFDCVVCCNNLLKGQLTRLKELGVDIHEQREEDWDYPIVAADAERGWKGWSPGTGWKFCPPRLRPEGHELWVDNDVIIRERLPKIDEWLESDDTCIISTDHRYDKEYYGAFGDKIPEGVALSSGLFGFPPHYDLGSEITEKCHEVLQGKPFGYSDDQGLAAWIIHNNKHIVTDNVLVVKQTPKKPFPKAIHFTTANRSDENDFWDTYRNSILL
jgi:hypothetical protein